jgi:hypothetical protein
MSHKHIIISFSRMKNRIESHTFIHFAKSLALIRSSGFTTLNHKLFPDSLKYARLIDIKK